ncbi:protein kinase [Lysobacter sp. GCM10012299]|uniref:protein kinase domain-containing protein n=1 Tax=Lysobacter sp. GCM10012299 TaxID=3317333 RepID=UPI003615819B
MDRASELERQRRALTILDAAMDLPPTARAAYLDRACAGDGRLRERVESLLDNDHEPAGGCAILDRDAGALLRALLRSEGLEDVTPELIDKRIGAWRIRSVIGRGGMGVVYHATRADGAFEQDAALKLIRFGLDTPTARERFLRERQILAQLRHSGIAVVLDGGMSACGAPYYVMELVNGQPMTAWCDARRLGLRRRVELFCQAVDAISHAHGQRVVHRDLKPSNLMVTDEGRVKLLDFGIAEWLDGASVHAQSPQSEVMTPQFAAPEQIERNEVTTASDIYQLGLLLYQLLSGALPYRLMAADVPGASMRERLDNMVSLAQAGATASLESASQRGHDPQSLGEALSGDLDAIVASCLVYQPERRYGSAAALADDLRNWLSGGVVSVRRDTPWYRAGKFVSRNRVGVAMLFALAVAMLVGTASTLWQARQAAIEARRAHREAITAEAATVFLERLFTSAMPLGGNDSGTTARELLERGAQRARIVFRNDPELRFRLLTTIGQNYATMGEDGTAVELFREALSVESTEIGPVARGTSAYQLATSSFLLGRFDEALIAQALEWIGHDRTPRAQALRSNLLRLRGDIQIVTAHYHQGMRSHEDARALAERVAASDPLPLLDVLVRQAFVQWKVLNLPDRAEEIFQRSEAVAARVDPREADLRRRFRIEFLIETGELELAGHLIDGALAFRSEVYGEHSMGVVQPLIHRGLLKLELGQHGAAERDFFEALRIAAAFDQSSSNLAVAAQVGLTRSQCAYGRYQQCLDGAIRARLAVVAIMGERGYAVPAMDALIAEAAEGLGRHFEAAEFARRAIAVLTSVHLPAGYPRQTLGIALYRSGKVDEGVAALRTARDELTRSRGALHAMTLATGVHLGRAILAQGRIGPARTTLLAVARQLRSASSHARRKSLSDAYLALAEVEERAGNVLLASEYARKASRVAD